MVSKVPDTFMCGIYQVITEVPCCCGGSDIALSSKREVFNSRAAALLRVFCGLSTFLIICAAVIMQNGCLISGNTLVNYVIIWHSLSANVQVSDEREIKN
jgi:hypothetical protein